MFKQLSLVSTLVLGSVLVLGNGSSSIVAAPAFAQEKSIEQMAPTSGWSVARIDGNAATPESYCALSRQYDKGFILTLGRNQAEEYSLAIDFQAAKLNTEKAYSITLQPGPGQIRAYEMMPASQRAMVVRLGYDDSFFKAMEESNLLKAEIDGTNYQFKMSNFSTGRKDLDNCLAGLKGKAPTKVASNFSAEKVEDAPPMAVKKVEPPQLAEPIKAETPKVEVAEATPEIKKESAQPSKVVVIEKVETPVQAMVEAPAVKADLPKAELAKATTSKVSKAIEISRVETKQISPMAMAKTNMPKVEAPKVEMAKVDPPKEGAPKIEMEQAGKTVSKAPEVKTSNYARSNNDELLEKVRDNRQVSEKVSSLSTSSIGQQTALQKQQREALEQLKADNERLNKALQAEISKPAPQTPDRSNEVASLQAELDKLQSELAKAKNTPDPIDEKLKADVEKLRQENEQLKLAMQEKAAAQAQEQARIQAQVEQEKAAQALAIQERAKQAEIKQAEQMKAISEEPKVASVDPEVMRQLESLQQENTRLSSALQGQEQKLSSFDAQSPEAEKELAAIRSQLKEIQEENKKLYEQAQRNRGFVDTAVAQTSSEALKQMREYEKKLEAAQNDNLALSKEIEELRRMKEDGRLAAVGGDWDLEKSTKRYNEAEREIKRLGLLLEQQRMAHRQEKAELEQMLFDPAVTDQEQRRRLSDLEMQLATAERELQAAGRSMPPSPTRTMVPLSPVEERVTLGTLTPDPIVAQQRENLEIQRLNNKVARQNQQLQAYNSALQTERMAAVPSPAVRSQPLASPSPVSNQPIARLPKPTMVEPPRVQQAAVPPRVPEPRAPEPVAKQAVASTGFGEGQLQQVLSSSGLTLSGKITRQSEGQYRWNANNLVGQAQIIPKAQAGSIDQFAQSYIAKAKQSCGGDFASLPAAAGGQGKAFEIACISPSRSTSSSVIFTQKGNDLIAISHESSAENMDMAMDARDRVAASL